jgi:hypothetical protein
MVESGGTSTTLLLGGLILMVALAAGILIVTVIYILRTRTKEQVTHAPALPSAPPLPRAAETPPPPSVEEVETSSEPLYVEPPGKPGEVMRVIRDSETGRICVAVGDRQYTHIREITDAQVGRRVLWAIADLIRFTGGMAVNAQAVRSAAQLAAQEEGLSSPQGAEEATEEQTEVAQDTPAEPDAPSSRLPAPPPEPLAATPPERGQRVRYSIAAFFRRGFAPPPASVPLPNPSSFVDEIEEILQGLIAQHQAPLSDEVHVSIGSENRLQVNVGGKMYNSASEVPDSEIRTLIQAAVYQWEQG